MKNNILDDTTVWIDFFRGKTKVPDHLEMLLLENLVWTCGIVMFEVFQEIKSENEKNKTLSILTTLPYLESTKNFGKMVRNFLNG